MSLHQSLKPEALSILSRLGVSLTEGALPARSPITGEVLASFPDQGAAGAEAAIATAKAAFRDWRNVPAPKRGELVRLWAEELRAHKADLGRLVSIEVGKVTSEGLGEVQEMIDICDFAVGLSRQLYGLTIASERPDHRMMETWHPLGVIGVISAFNFPVAVWSWNTALALVCGNAVVWKPSEKASLSALGAQATLDRAMARFNAEGGHAPAGLAQLVLGARAAGEALVDSHDVALISATGSTRMGREVGPKVAARFGRCLLELGGNNAAIVGPTADLDLTLRGVAFAAMGTAGQRCTTLRRLFLHDSIYDAFLPRLKAAYASVTVGDPMSQGVLVGPLIDEAALAAMQAALDEARAAGGTVHGGEAVTGLGGSYARPAVVEMPAQTGPVLRETFAPILYVMKYSDFDEVLELHNACRRACPRRSSPMTCARPRPSCRRAAAIAALPTSTSARRVRKSAGPSAARRKPAAAANPARMRGRPICAVRPTR